LRRKFGFNKKIRRNLLIPPTGYLGKYTAHNDYTEEEVRRISIATAILVSAAVLKVGGALDLEEPIRLPSPHRINFSVCLSVSPSVPYENK
jgi:hypothetical protein